MIAEYQDGIVSSALDRHTMLDFYAFIGNNALEWAALYCGHTLMQVQ